MSSSYRAIAPVVTQGDGFPQSVTALSFDPVSDTLWTGNDLGKVVAFYGIQGARGVSFEVGGGYPVSKISVNDQYVRAIGSSGLGVGSWSKGGANKWFYRSLHPALTFSTTVSGSSNIAVSTNTPELLLVNNSTGALVRQLQVPSLLTHLVSSHTLLISGSADGYIRTHDFRTRKMGEHSEASVKAHAKSVQGIDVSGNFIYSIGSGISDLIQARAYPETMVKVYDLRNLKALPPVSFPAGPGFVNAMPRRSATVVVTSNTGFVNIIDVTNPGTGGEHVQLEISSYVTSVAVSPTGVYLAFGDAEGMVHMLTAADEEGSLPLNGFEGQPIEWFDTPDPIPDLEWTDSTPLNTIGMPFYDNMLLSSWTPKFLPSVVYYPPPAKIPPQILATMKTNEFVSYAALPKELQGRRNVISTAPRKDQGRFRSGKARVEQAEPDTPTSENVENVPRPYRKVEIEYSKFGVEDFDFGFFNKTEYSGLESHIVNSYTNSLVQTLTYTYPIRRLAESHILTSCNREHCLLCELGFCMRMLMDAKGTNCQASNFCKTVGAIAQVNNVALLDFGKPSSSYSDMIQAFHRFLLDHLSSEGNSFPYNPVIVPHTTQPSASLSIAAAPVTQLLGIDSKNFIVCTSCKATREKENMVHVIDLHYPRAISSSGSTPTDFASILRNSILFSPPHRATCQSCRQLVSFESRRAISSDSLPPILAVNTSIYSGDHTNIKFWLDNRQGRFLNSTIELRGQIDGVDDTNIVTYELRSLIVEVAIRDKPGHLVSIVKVPEVQRGKEMTSPWIIFNDFVVTNVSEQEALSIPGPWKVPSVLYYERVDMREKLNFNELPNELDFSILWHDINIAVNRDASAIKHELLTPNDMPNPGTLISIDAEFVQMQQEETEYRSDGMKKTIRPARLGLARVSVLRGEGPKTGIPFIDDHINTSELVVDYLTEFSGIKYGDLDPNLSRQTLVPLKVAYKKLRLLVDLGCIFIGHGLSKDFRIINLFVPPEQVLDTVDLYFIASRQRRLSLRFLSWFVLKENIQSVTHDSIEDARCALLLYKKYQEYESDDLFDEKLEELYREGKQYNWKPPPTIAPSPAVAPAAPAPPPPVPPPVPTPPVIMPFPMAPMHPMMHGMFQPEFRPSRTAPQFQRHFMPNTGGSQSTNWRRGQR